MIALLLLMILGIPGQLSFATSNSSEGNETTIASKKITNATSKVTIGFSTKKGEPPAPTDGSKPLSLLPQMGGKASIASIIIGLLIIMIYYLKKRNKSLTIKKNKKEIY